MKVIKLNESVLQDLKRDHENVRKEYGEEVYNALNDYIKQGIDLGNVLYNKGEWDKFIKWAQDKGVKAEQPTNTIDEDLSTDTFEIYGDEETLRQLERDLQESVSYPNGNEVSNDDVNLDIALDYMFGEDRDPNNDNYTDDEKQRAINYWIEKTDSPFPGWKDKRKSINEDQYGRYSDTFKKIIREYTDSALIVGLVDDIVRYAKEADLRDLYYERGYDKLKGDEIIESINEKDILHKLDQFTSKITINKDDEKALKDILLKKNVSFKIDDSKADKLTFKLNYKKLNEDLSENGQTVQRYIDSEIPEILISLSDKLPNMYSSDMDVLLKSCKSFYNLCESLVMYYNRHTKIEEDLTDVATATLEGPQEGAQFGLAGLVNEAIQKELATVDEYNTLAINARSEGFEDIVNVINEINTEENKHIGQLQELLKTLSPNAEAIDVGKVEGEQQLEEEVNKDTKSPNTNDDILVVEEDDNVDWKPIYNKFKQIEKDLNNDGEAVTAVIDKMYLDNKDDPAYVKAFQVWSEQ